MEKLIWPQDFINKIICGDCLEILRQIPDESVHCCITSPPYWGLRDYGIVGQIGLEKTPEEYVSKIVEVFREVKRAPKKDGTLWLNLGDTYAGSGCGTNDYRTPLSISISRPELYASPRPQNKAPAGLKAKDLVGIPWRVAFALQADGWYLRSDIIWAKSNAIPESVRDRPTRVHEYIFLLTKSRKYFFDQEAVREPCQPSTFAKLKYPVSRPKRKLLSPEELNKINYIKPYIELPGRKEKILKSGRNIRSVWIMAKTNFKEAHFATFPLELPKKCIKAGCPMGGIVLDPFVGSGTTCLAAKELGRNYIVIDLKEEYCKMAEKRINQGVLF